MIPSTVLSICVVLITVGVWLGLFFFILTMLQLRRAANAVEALATRLQDGTAKLHQFAATVRSGWMRAIEMGVAAATTFWGDRRQGGAAASKKSSRSDREENENGRE